MINNIFKKMETLKDFKDDRIKYREIICPISTLLWIPLCSLCRRITSAAIEASRLLVSGHSYPPA